MSWLRKGRRFFASVLLTALLLPVLMGIWSAAATSAEQKLLSDIAYNICSPSETGGGGEPSPAANHNHCILCTTHNQLLDVSNPPDLAIAPALVLRRLGPQLALHKSPPNRPDLRSTAPRAPPAI